MPLTDTAIKNAKSIDKPYKMQDEKGMYLLVNPNSGKYFRYNYRFGGKRKTLALGTYPATSLRDAREKRDAAIKQIAGGIDPSENRKAIKQSRAESAANSFEVIAREWYERNMIDKSEHHQKRAMSLFQRDIFPYLGSKPISDIKATELLAALRRIEARNAIETAHRALQICGQVFRYAIATGRTERDIVGAD